MPDDPTQWKWMFAGEWYKEGSSQPWRGIQEEGVIAADHPAIAAILLLTGQPFDDHEPPPANGGLPDYDGERGFVLEIRPVEEVE